MSLEVDEEADVGILANLATSPSDLPSPTERIIRASRGKPTASLLNVAQRIVGFEAGSRSSSPLAVPITVPAPVSPTPVTCCALSELEAQADQDAIGSAPAP